MRRRRAGFVAVACVVVTLGATLPSNAGQAVMVAAGAGVASRTGVDWNYALEVAGSDGGAAGRLTYRYSNGTVTEFVLDCVEVAPNPAASDGHILYLGGADRSGERRGFTIFDYGTWLPTYDVMIDCCSPAQPGTLCDAPDPIHHIFAIALYPGVVVVP